jgi:hypothetical protein
MATQTETMANGSGAPEFKDELGLTAQQWRNLSIVGKVHELSPLGQYIVARIVDAYTIYYEPSGEKYDSEDTLSYFTDPEFSKKIMDAYDHRIVPLINEILALTLEDRSEILWDLICDDVNDYEDECPMAYGNNSDIHTLAGVYYLIVYPELREI